MGVAEAGDLARGPADAAADVEHAHAGLEADLRGEVVLVPGDGLVEGLALVVASKVERRAPAVLVQLRGSACVEKDATSLGRAVIVAAERSASKEDRRRT